MIFRDMRALRWLGTFALSSTLCLATLEYAIMPGTLPSLSGGFAGTQHAKAAAPSVVFTGSQLSLSRSVFTLEVSTVSEPAVTGLPVLLVSNSIDVRGVDRVRPVQVSGNLKPGSQTVVFHVEAGPPLTGVDTVEISVGSIILRSADSWELAYGPWVHEVPVDAVTLMQGAKIVPVGQSTSSTGVVAQVREIRLTQDETFVTYDLTAPMGFAGPAGSPARIRLPSGEVMEGRSARTARNASGELALVFPALPTGTKSFELEFGPYVLDTAGADVGIELPTDWHAPSGQRTLIIGKAVTSPAGNITVSTLEAGNSGFAIEFAGVSDTGVQAAISPEATIVATDNVGRTYDASSIEVRFDSVDGTPRFERAVVEFSSALPTEVRHIELSIDKLWREVELPARVNVVLE